MQLPLLNRRGFTLIEVVMAIGIAAFAMVSIFGVLAVGLDSKERSSDRNTAAQLAWNTFEEIKSTPDLDQVKVTAILGTFPRYYGPAGEYLGSGPGYIAGSTYRILVTQSGALPDYMQDHATIFNVAVESPPANVSDGAQSRTYNFTQAIAW